MKKNDIDVLAYIVDYCNHIVGTIERFGQDADIFKRDLDFKNSVSMSLLQIGELVGHLSEEFKLMTNSKIPWNEIKAMRNIFAHNYGRMNVTVIWETAIYDIPPLKEFCESILQEEQHKAYQLNEEELER